MNGKSLLLNEMNFSSGLHADYNKDHSYSNILLI